MCLAREKLFTQTKNKKQKKTKKTKKKEKRKRTKNLWDLEPQVLIKCSKHLSSFLVFLYVLQHPPHSTKQNPPFLRRRIKSKIHQVKLFLSAIHGDHGLLSNQIPTFSKLELNYHGFSLATISNLYISSGYFASCMRLNPSSQHKANYLYCEKKKSLMIFWNHLKKN